MPKKLPTKKQQGKTYTQAQRDEIIKSLRPYLQLDYDLKNACIMVGVTYNTVYDWVVKDNALLIKIKGWRNSVNAKSRQNLAKSVSNGDLDNSKWWLERRDKDNFSTRTEKTGKEGGPIELKLLEVAKKRANRWFK